MSKGGLGSAGSGFKNFLGGLALGKLRWNAGAHGQTLATYVLRGVSRCLSSGYVSTSAAVVIVGKRNCTSGSGSGRFQDKCSFTPKPFSVDPGSM